MESLQDFTQQSVTDLRGLENASDVRELIVYACPLGDLGDRLERYFQQSRHSCGPNLAHRYMPHCTLTGFFHDEGRSIPFYIDALDRALQAISKLGTPEIAVTGAISQPDFHYLTVESNWLKQLMFEFVHHATSATRLDALRLKDCLHVSLAYGFVPSEHYKLQAIAVDCIDWQVPTQWQLRLHERRTDNHWLCYRSWDLTCVPI
ncbi:MAG: hypothetical protein AB4040_01120 [Synechococcus sp.]